MSKSRVSLIQKSTARMAEVSAQVIIGPETARQLTQSTGIKFEPGDMVDLGCIAYHHKNPLRQLWGFITKRPGTETKKWNSMVKAVN